MLSKRLKKNLLFLFDSQTSLGLTPTPVDVYVLTTGWKKAWLVFEGTEVIQCFGSGSVGDEIANDKLDLQRFASYLCKYSN